MPLDIDEQLALASLEKDVLQNVTSELIRELLKRDRNDSRVLTKILAESVRNYRASAYTQALLGAVPGFKVPELRGQAVQRVAEAIATRVEGITRSRG